MMTSKLAFWRRRAPAEESIPTETKTIPAQELNTDAFLDLDIAPDDPILAYFQNASGPVDMDKLQLDTPGVQALREEGVRMAVPLVSQGELIGIINLGSRLSEQDYSSDDRKLLNDLASQAAPAVRVAQLVRQQKIEAAERERIEQELRVARIIQQTLLPKTLPDIDGWAVSAHWQPAREVSGDFYDFYHFPDGRLGIIIADVTDKGVPAALVMATTRSMLRAAAERLQAPSQVLERANEVLVPDMPPKMFVTCLYALLDPVTGKMRYANAGHNLPFQQREGDVRELRARGMPLGLMPGMQYEEKETTIQPGDRIVFYSDGLVEAHNPEGDMYGTPRLQAFLSEHTEDRQLSENMLGSLHSFTGPNWEQEDDVTFVIVQCQSLPVISKSDLTRLAVFEIPSEPGNERRAMEEVAAVVRPLGLEPTRIDKLKTAVAEATMNAMEHGNKYQPDIPVIVEVLRNDSTLAIHITDYGDSQLIPISTDPNLEAKLAGEQSPRGWGLFLIQSMVDEVNIISKHGHHTLEMLFSFEGGHHARPTT